MTDTLNTSIIEWLNDYASRGIFITDSNLVIQGWNRWLERQSGRESSDMIGIRLFDALPEIPGRGLDGFYQDALKGHVQIIAQRLHRYLIALSTDFETPLGIMEQSARIAPLMENGRVIGTVTSIEDVTERIIRENELRLAREAAESANLAKDKLLATLSHDLRTPLTSILGWVRLIQNPRAEAAMMSKGLKSIESNARVQLQLLDQILDTSRIASGKIELFPEQADLVEIIAATIDAIMPLAESKDIRIETDIPAGPRTCVVDAKRIHQVFWNLLSNAVKFTPPAGTVRVTLEFSGSEAQLKVADSGMGIGSENLEQVFEPLWQSQEAGGYGGLGLGLSIAKQLVELHGGSVRAESPGKGKGATFIVDLPQTARVMRG